MSAARSRPFGIFVHHQGRGHAERAAAIVRALPASRPVVLFCARDDLFGGLPSNASVIRIPSLFEPTGDEAAAMGNVATPSTLHCAPLGWPGIRRAMATIAGWFGTADPALMICDVSAEIAQLARICSVPHVKVLQHGNRGDPGHRAAYDGAVGLLAPFARSLAQPEWGPQMLERTCFAGGLGCDVAVPDRAAARAAIGMSEVETLVLVASGGGGTGLATAPLGVGARATPDARWITIGSVQRDWHATEPANLEHRGWVDNAGDFVAAADLVVASTGNTTCHLVMAAGRPFLAIPEWRYFDEQHRKAEALAAAGVATVRPHLPSSAEAWREALEETRRVHDPAAQRVMIDERPAGRVADWLESLAERLWARHMSGNASGGAPAGPRRAPAHDPVGA